MFSRLATLVRAFQVIALLTLLLLAVLLYRSLGHVWAAERQIEQTREVIEQIYEARLGALRSGIWLRNHVTSPSSEMLARVRSSADEATRAVQRLAVLTDGDAAQRTHARVLVSDMSALLAGYLAGADLAEQEGAAAVEPMLQSRVQHELTRRVRDRLDDMEKLARQSLKAQRKQEEHSPLGIRRLLLSVGGVTVVLLACVLWNLRQARRSDAASSTSMGPEGPAGLMNS